MFSLTVWPLLGLPLWPCFSFFCGEQSLLLEMPGDLVTLSRAVKDQTGILRILGRPGVSFISFLYCSMAPLVTPGRLPTLWSCQPAGHQHTSLSPEARGVGRGCSLPSQDLLRLEDRHRLPSDSRKLCSMTRTNEKNFREDGALAAGFLPHG